MFMSFNYDKPKAVRLNPVYARSTGWIDRYTQIAITLGFHWMSPTAETLADAVFYWQDQHTGLTADGILGPKSWAVLEPYTRFSPAPLPVPDHLQVLPKAKTVEEPAVPPKMPTNMWFGLFIDYGGLMVVAGMNTMMGTLRSYDNPDKHFDAMAERVRLGPGLGGGVGFSLVLVSNLKQSKDLQGLTSTGFDFNLSLGVPFAKAAQNAVKYPRLVKIADRLQEVADTAGPGAVKQAAREAAELKPDEFATIAKFIRENDQMRKAAGNTEGVQVCAVSLPLPGAVEASLFWQQEQWTVLGR